MMYKKPLLLMGHSPYSLLTEKLPMIQMEIVNQGQKARKIIQ